jgi:protocatechuate 3,4-dioxygenase beta subunit
MPTPGQEVAMTRKDERHQSRRQFLRASVALPAVVAVVFGPEARAQTGRRPTPACGEDARPTPPQTAGPFFTPNSPRRASLLEPGMPGIRLVVEGAVVRTDCRPVPGALLDFWQADARGRYDNAGYRFRGHQFADEAGRFRLQTVVPGQYSGRTRHLHVRVQAPGEPVLTTQLYFPDEPANARDRIFSPDLLMAVRDVEDGRLGRFDFVLPLEARR